MKTKAYKLAAELGVHEQSVLEWLRSNGYPNARRADMIRSDVAQAARKALGKHPRPQRPFRGGSGAPISHSTPRHENRFSREKDDTPMSRTGESLSMSFAELLGDHLPMESEAGGLVANVDVAATQEHDFRHLERHRAPEGQPPSISPSISREYGRIASERFEEELKVERARVDALERQLADQAESIRLAAESQAHVKTLNAKHTDLQMTISHLRQDLANSEDQCRTLEAVSSQLRVELDDALSIVEEHQSVVMEHDSVVGDLETARQREIAWRKRALELERAAHAGDDLSALLKKKGMASLDDRISVLRAMLDSEETAEDLFKSIRQVDAGLIDRLLDEKMRKTCSHPVCRKVTLELGKSILRVDDDSQCHFCSGNREQRWFNHLAFEGERAGVRRLLVVGGRPEVQGRLRELSQGRSIDLRLIPGDEEVTQARVESRVEGCDLVICWSAFVVAPELTEAYVRAADTYGRALVSVIGHEDDVIRLARAAIYRIARTHIFAST